MCSVCVREYPNPLRPSNLHYSGQCAVIFSCFFYLNAIVWEVLVPCLGELIRSAADGITIIAGIMSLPKQNKSHPKDSKLA